MITKLKLLDYDKIGVGTPISAGECSLVNNSQAKEYISSLFEETNMDSIDMVSMCSCGKLSGEFYKGVICPQCNTVVDNIFVDSLNYKAYLEIPDELPPVLHPIMYRVLKGSWLKTLLPILLNPTAELPVRCKGKIGAQGFSYFYDNFDDIINFLARTHNRKQAEISGTLDFIKKYRHLAFTRKLPVLNGSLHILTQDSKCHFTDNSGKHVLKALIVLSSLSYNVRNKVVDDKFVDRNLWEFYESYLEYMDTIEEDKLFTKHGFMRKHILGTRYHCSYRGVIVPICEPHNIDELHWPWRIGVIELTLEILNRLIHQHGHNINEAYGRHHKALYVYDPLVGDIMDQLIAECGYTDPNGNFVNLKGLPTLLVKRIDISMEVYHELCIFIR